MAIDSAPYIKEMDLTSPSNRDPRVEGAGQIRAVKTALKNSFPNIGGEVTADHVKMNQVFQAGTPTVGMIMMFGGSTAPSGWAFCDGRAYNGVLTPDLRNRFIVGWNPNGEDNTASPGYVGNEKTNPGDRGGSNVEANIGSKLRAKAHALTLAQLPDAKLKADLASHHYSLGEYVTGPERQIPGEDKRFSSNRYPVVKLGSGQVHSHEIEVPDGKPFDKRPAWYALAYIMFVGFPAT